MTVPNQYKRKSETKIKKISKESRNNKTTPKPINKKNSLNTRNRSQLYHNGRTLKTQDKYLPTDKKGKSDNLKDKRHVVIVDSNKNDELAVVRLTTQNQSNTTKLPTYKKGNKKTTFFKNFVETKDNENKPIKIDNKKFIKNDREMDLNKNELNKVQKTVRRFSKQASANNNKIRKLKNDAKK